MGIDIPGAIAEWTSEVFSFINTSADKQDSKAVPPQLEELYEELSKYVSDEPFPCYIPDEYRLVNTQYHYDEDIRTFNSLLSNGEQKIIIHYIIHFTENAIIEYEKNDIRTHFYYISSLCGRQEKKRDRRA